MNFWSRFDLPSTAALMRFCTVSSLDVDSIRRSRRELFGGQITSGVERCSDMLRLVAECMSILDRWTRTTRGLLEMGS